MPADQGEVLEVSGGERVGKGKIGDETDAIGVLLEIVEAAELLVVAHDVPAGFEGPFELSRFLESVPHQEGGEGKPGGAQVKVNDDALTRRSGFVGDLLGFPGHEKALAKTALMKAIK